MIYDKLDNFDRYAGLFPGVWQEVKDFFSAGVIPESGRYDLLPYINRSATGWDVAQYVDSNRNGASDLIGT